MCEITRVRRAEVVCVRILVLDEQRLCVRTLVLDEQELCV